MVELTEVENIVLEINGLYDLYGPPIFSILVVASPEAVIKELRADIVTAILNGLLAISSLLVFIVTICKKREFYSMLSLILIFGASLILFIQSCKGPLSKYHWSGYSA